MRPHILTTPLTTLRARLSHHLRLLLLAFAATCAVALNHRHVAVVRLVADAGPAPTSAGGTVVTVGTHRVVVRERVSLESIHADALTLAGPLVAWLPPTSPARDPLGAWLQTKGRMLGALPTSVVHAVGGRAVPPFARLLGASVAPQAP